MAALEIDVQTYQLLGYDLQTEIDAYNLALADHANTIDVPAPTTTSLVEGIVKHHDGLFVIVPSPAKAEMQPLPKDAKYYKSTAERAKVEAEVAKLEALPK